MTIYGGFGGLWSGWCGRGGLWNLAPTGLPGRTGAHRTRKTGQYMGGRVRRWFGLTGFGGGGEAVVVVAFDGVADGFAPGIGAEGLTIFVLGDVDRLHEGLGQVGDRVSGFGF